MSVLELRLLKNDMYETPHDKLMLIARRDVGTISNISVRLVIFELSFCFTCCKIFS